MSPQIAMSIGRDAALGGMAYEAQNPFNSLSSFMAVRKAIAEKYGVYLLAKATTLQPL